MRSRRRRSFGPKLVLPLALAALAFSPARQARADFVEDFFKGVAAVVVVGGVGIGSNIAFTIHDASLASDDELPTTGWSIAETVITPAETLLFNGFLVWGHASGEVDDSPAINFVLIPAIWTGQMATHGIWSLASDKVKPADLYGVSWAIGANLAFTSGAVGAAFNKRLGGLSFGIAEMIGTTPTIAVGLSKLTGATLPDQGAWTALTAWSGALFLHGMVSTVMGFKEKEKEDEEKAKEEKKNAFLRDFRFTIAPTLVSDGIRKAPGFTVGGVF